MRFMANIFSIYPFMYLFSGVDNCHLEAIFVLFLKIIMIPLLWCNFFP